MRVQRYDVQQFLVAGAGGGLAVGAILCNRTFPYPNPNPNMYSNPNPNSIRIQERERVQYGNGNECIFGFGAITLNHPYNSPISHFEFFISLPMRFFLWILIAFSLPLAAGLYWTSRGETQGQAAESINESKETATPTTIIGHWTH